MSDPGPLVFFYDYVDPASFLLELRLRELGYHPGSNLHALPFEMNPPPNPLLDPGAPAWETRWREAEEEAKGMGLALSRPPIVPWTRKAHELAFHASEYDLAGEIHEALFRAYLIDGLDIGRVDVLVELGARHGLDTAGTKATLDVDKHGASLETIRSGGAREGVMETPTLFLNETIRAGYPTEKELRLFLGKGPALNGP